MREEPSVKPANPRILTINGGSSSIKFALFEAGDSLRRTMEGAIERIGLPEATLRRVEGDPCPVVVPSLKLVWGSKIGREMSRKRDYPGVDHWVATGSRSGAICYAPKLIRILKNSHSKIISAIFLSPSINLLHSKAS
jgi:hypothetical protein